MSRLLFIAILLLSADLTSAQSPSPSSAGDLVYNLKPWGYEDARAIPWKYVPGDGGHEFINGKLRFFIVTDAKWDDINKTVKYKKVPDLRTKL